VNTLSHTPVRPGADHPRLSDWGEGAYGDDSAPYGSERPYTGVKGPHRSERAPCRYKGPVKVKRPTEVNFKQSGGQTFSAYKLIPPVLQLSK